MENKNIKIMIEDDEGRYELCIRRTDTNLIARFSSIEEAKEYAKNLGLKSGFKIKS